MEGNVNSKPSQDAAHIIILSLQGVKSNYLVYAENADKNHDVIDTYNLYILLKIRNKDKPQSMF